MKIKLGCMVATLAVSTLAFAQEKDWSSVQIKTTHVRGSVYMLEGEGGNIGASVGDDGIVIVDDQYAPLADKIRAALKGVADKPVRFVINTHYHGDHAGGNIEFQKEASIIAHENVRKRLGADPKTGKEALPIITFEHDVSVHLNGDDIRALHAPHAHTDGDVLVYFTQSNVVHMGDNFVRYGFPYIDMKAGGSVSGMIAGLEAALERLPADVKVIPGHGALASVDDVKAFVEMLKATRAAVADGVKAGKSAEQLKQENVLKPWQKPEGTAAQANSFIDTLYSDVTGTGEGRWLKHN